MRTLIDEFSRVSLKRLSRAAFCAALGVIGAFTAGAAAAETISLSEPACLSCEYDDGLPRSSSAAPFAGPASVEADDANSFETASTFGPTSQDRAKILLPARRADRPERPRWTRGEKALMWSFASLNAVDAYQTMNAPGNVREANPLLGSWAGDHPSALETLAFKSASTYGMYKLAGRIHNRKTRRLALILANVVQLSVAAHNEAVTGGSLF